MFVGLRFPFVTRTIALRLTCGALSAVALSLISSAASGLPVSPPAASAPASQPVVAIDQNTPRGALKVLTVSMNKGDAAGIRSVFSPTNEVETKMVDAVVGQQTALMKFRDAAIKQYGNEEARKLVGDFDEAQTQSLMALDAVPEKVTGDSAEIGEGDQLMHLKKISGKWTLPVSTLAPQITADTVDKELKQVADRSKFFTEMAADVSAGKYKTADDAGKALQLKVMEQVMANDKATSQPATGPAATMPAPGAGSM